MTEEDGPLIDPSREMTIAELDELQKTTQGRFSWTFARNSGAQYAFCVFVNYDRSTGNRVKDKNGAWKVFAPQTGMVKIVD